VEKPETAALGGCWGMRIRRQEKGKKKKETLPASFRQRRKRGENDEESPSGVPCSIWSERGKGCSSFELESYLYRKEKKWRHLSRPSCISREGGANSPRMWGGKKKALLRLLQEGDRKKGNNPKDVYRVFIGVAINRILAKERSIVSMSEGEEGPEGRLALCAGGKDTSFS